MLIATLLRLRPGRLGLWLWYLGPSLLVILAGVLLIGSLRSSRQWRHGVNTWHIAGYLGLIVFIVSLRTYGAYPSSHDRSPSAVEFRLPLDGPVTVAWGGETSEVNYHVFLPDQRWAYDLLVTDGGRSAAGEGARLEDHHAWDLPGPRAGRRGGSPVGGRRAGGGAGRATVGAGRARQSRGDPGGA